MGKIPYTPDLIVDENLSPGFVNELIKHGLKPLYIPNVRRGMSDTEIKYMGNKYGGIPIATKNVKHFSDYTPLIELGPKNNLKDTLEYLGYA